MFVLDLPGERVRPLVSPFFKLFFFFSFPEFGLTDKPLWTFQLDSMGILMDCGMCRDKKSIYQGLRRLWNPLVQET